MKAFLLLITFIFALVIFIKATRKEVKYVKSDIDNKEYLVRDIKNSKQAANMLARLKNNMEKLVKHLNEGKNTKYKEHEKYITRLVNRMQNTEIYESGEDSVYTSYSVNKGEELVFCLRSKNNKNKLHDINLIMYVALHEMTHVANPDYGHDPPFNEIFHFLATVAIELGIYHKIPFNVKPEEYCGLMIKDSVV